MWSMISSWLGLVAPAQSPPPEPPRVVLVPPFFQRDVRGLSRFCRSSYDNLANRKQLSRLLRDHLSPELRGVLLLSPPDDPRVSVRAKLRQSGGSMVLRWQPASAASLHTFVEMAANLESPGDVALRGSYLHTGSGLGAFLTAPLAADVSGQTAKIGVRYSSTDATVGAIFVPRRRELHKIWLAGRYHGLTLGLQLSPNTTHVGQILSPLLSGCRGGGGLKAATAAVPPPPPLGTTTVAAAAAGCSSAAAGGRSPSSSSSLAELKSWFRRHASILLAYSPPPRPGATGAPFTASVEMAEGGTLTFSFFQHLAATRQVVNPFEEDEVVGITNYLDIGLQLTTSIGAPPPAAATKLIRPVRATTAPTATTGSGGGSGGGGGGGLMSTAAATATSTPAANTVEGACVATAGLPASIDLAASWQINKNWLLKARVGSGGAAAAVGARVWQSVSASMSACVALDYARLSTPRYGVELCVENFGPLRYERGADDVAAGRALLQRHEASRQDLDNFAGRGVLIRRSTQHEAAAAACSGDSADLVGERRRVAELL